MDKHAGPLRNEHGLASGLEEIHRLHSSLQSRPPSATRFATARRDWFDLRNMLLVAQAVTEGALARKESRGAHQREDFPSMSQHLAHNQVLCWRNRQIEIRRVAAAADRRERV
jgi:succinate dehydrogenase/fumarate reductase flavoprotein subunit